MEKETQGKSQGFFSWDNLNEIADFESHLAFAEETIDKYHWDSSVRKELLRLLDKIKEKQKDDKLNLSVIGEFSTGKSTFINAMLRRDLLVSSALQGTTVAATIIEYSQDYGLRLQRNDGKEFSFQYPDLAELKEQLAKYTTEPEIAQSLNKVYVYLPSKSLASGFRIIDTPGTNAIDRWHEEVTIRTIQEISDISIILVNANQVLPDSFCCFIEDNLASILHQCVFVVTKLDMIPVRERERVLSYVKRKLDQAFDLKDAMVLPYASLEVLNDFTSNSPSHNNLDLLQMSYANESQILLHMAKQRAIAQTKKLIHLIDSMYASISGQMNSISNTYEEELALLLRTQQADLSSFILEQKKIRTLEYDTIVKLKRPNIIDYFDELAAKAQKTIIAKIDEQTNLDNLKAYVNNQLADACAKEAQTLISEAESKYSCVVEWFEEEILEFLIAFEELFKNLDILNLDLSQNKYVLPKTVEIQTADLGAAAKYIAAELSKENRAYLGGVAAGAAIGTAIAPGVGTIIGGFIGLLGGGAMAPNLSDVKKSSKEKLSTPLRGYFNKIVFKITVAFDDYIRQTGNCISVEIDKYLAAYNNVVKKRMEEEQSKRIAIEAKIKTIRKDLANIEQRKFRLTSIREQMDALSRRS